VESSWGSSGGGGGTGRDLVIPVGTMVPGFIRRTISGSPPLSNLYGLPPLFLYYCKLTLYFILATYIVCVLRSL